MIIAHVNHQGLPTFNREIGKIKELVKVGYYGTPRFKNPYNYDFFVVLPTNTKHISQSIQKASSKTYTSRNW